MKLSIGRVVQYYPFGVPGGGSMPAPVNAIITGVQDDGDLSLAVLTTSGMLLIQDVPNTTAAQAGCWSAQSSVEVPQVDSQQ